MGRVRKFNPTRKFRGNQHNGLKNITVEGGTCAPNLHSSATSSASRNKLSGLFNISDDIRESPSLDAKNSVNIIVDLSMLSLFINKSVSCSQCNSVNSIYITEESECRRGLSTKLMLECKQCKYRNSTMTSPVNPRRVSCVNLRFTYAMRCIGKGLQAARTFCALMDLPPPPSKFDTYNDIIYKSVKVVAQGSMWSAAREVKELEGSSDTTIVVDGSWQKRGFSSLHGVVTATSLLTGKVLDVAAYSKYCAGCTKGENHACVKNFDGYSGGMEVEGAVEIFSRSELTRGLRYVEYLGDGDSKGFQAVCEAKPYGSEVKIKKIECVGHIQKRMGRYLLELCKSLKGQKLDDGKPIGGKGRLTKSEIDLLQTYYGKAIRSNCNNVQEMKKAVWASFFHKSSTDERHSHGLCLPGADSWCGYQRSLVTGEEYTHKHSLPPAVLEKIKPVYRKLADEELLKRCLHGKTQNQNESFNSCIWQRVPKTVFVGAKTIHIGVYDAIICFNDGCYKRIHVMKAMDIEPGENMKIALRALDLNRVAKADRALEEMSKEARVKRRGLKRKQEDKEAKQTDSYSPGAF